MGFYNSALSTTSADSTDYKIMAANIWSDTDKKAITFAGRMKTDTVCLGSSCVEDYDFFQIDSMIYEANSDWHWNGVLGLGPVAQGNGPSIVQTLRDQGVIGQATASIVMNRNYSRDGDSYVSFGGLPNGATVGAATQHTIDPEWPSSWTIKMNGFATNGVPMEGMSGYKAMLNPAQTGIALNNADFDNLFKGMMPFKCMICQCSVVGSCSTFWPDMPSISITLEDTVYTLPPQAYTEDYEGSCYLKVQGHSADQHLYVLGDTFFETFVPTFNIDDGTMTLALNANAQAGASISMLSSTAAVAPTSGLSPVTAGATAGAVLAVSAALYFKRRNTKRA